MQGMGWEEERALKHNTSKEITTQHIKLSLWAHLYLRVSRKTYESVLPF